MNKISPITNLIDENKIGPRSVSLISSCGCNLNCSYCVINKSVNSFQH
jgi:sulfatase maturation enzyme AslB (radical SAM superfamily)